MLRVTSLSSTVRLYGQSSYSKRITGRFSIDRYCADTEPVDLVEGHVNKMGTPQRLISFVDSSDNWCVSQKFQSSGITELRIFNNAHDLVFFVERVVVEVAGSSEDPLIGEPCRGQVRLPGDADAVFSVYETDTSGIRRFYLNGPLGLLLKVERRVQQEGECLLVPV